MNSGKLDNALNLALQTSQEVREKSFGLEDGYDSEEESWELLIKYGGDIDAVASKLSVPVVKLLNNYAIMIVPESKVSALSAYPEIEYVEKPFPLIFASTFGRINSCMEAVQLGNTGLYGKGVIVAIIDSGIDFTHPDFLNEDGTTRILELWDQTIPGKPPTGYQIGTVYDQAAINEAIKTKDLVTGLRKVESIDTTGHGTHVAGIACGNGRASKGAYRGVAPQSDMLIVKLGSSSNQFIPKTTELIQGIDYCVRTAIKLLKPLVINLSFGNNYGSHDGNSLLEQYIDQVSNQWKMVFAIGTGNEGASGRHTRATVKQGAEFTIAFAVPTTELAFSMQIWKNYVDDITIEVISPSGARSGRLKKLLDKQEFVLDTTKILVYYAEPRPSNQAQQIYMEFIPEQSYLGVGQWRIMLYGEKIVDGVVDFWMPTSSNLVSNAKFLKPTPELTLTIPSTASRAISVGAYDAYSKSYANFSGRGYLRGLNVVKPDLVAPGVNIMSAAPNGGYASRSGTSMATPFVSGAAALMMEWGIVRGNDPYLYGEKVKAYLIKGAKQLPGMVQTPNPSTGWGALCLSDSFPKTP
ncbi:MAG: S8 family peptidase [bacterium]|nr:S8 family peptidase [bacterium]